MLKNFIRIYPKVDITIAIIKYNLLFIILKAKKEKTNNKKISNLENSIRIMISRQKWVILLKKFTFSNNHEQ